MAKYGRAPDELKIIPGLAVFVGRTESEADELFEQLESMIPEAIGVDYLSKIIGTDMSIHPVDGPVPDIVVNQVGGTAIGASIIAMAQAEKLTIRQAYQRILPQQGGNMIKGTPSQVADMMEDWYRSKACDGFMLAPPVMPRALADFVDLVVPELQRRGVFKTAYRGATCARTWACRARRAVSSATAASRRNEDAAPAGRAAMGLTLGRLLLGRALQAVPLVFAVVTLTFFFIRLAPGDPAYVLAGDAATPEYLAAIRAEYGLDKPVWEQYLAFLGKALTGDFGTSIFAARPVFEVILERFPATVLLTGTAMVLASVVGIGLGVASARRAGCGPMRSCLPLS